MSSVREVVTDLKLKHIDHPDLVRISIPGDGSCFFHAILRSFNRRYIEAETKEERKKYSRLFRDVLANLLEKKDKSGKMLYDTVLGGNLREFSKAVPSYSLKEMQKELRGNGAVGDMYQALISEQFNKDIYIIDLKREDVYTTGSDLATLYKKRDSIIIGYRPGHFEVIGVRKTNGVISTFFKPNHRLVVKIYSRLSKHQSE